MKPASQESFAFKHLALLCDFYEFSMSQGYFKQGLEDKICYFEIFFRKAPDNAAFAIFAGLDDVLDFVKNLRFNEEDLAFLKKQGIFCDEFLHYLASFCFDGEIYAQKEGSVVFANEPLMIIKAKISQAQLLETFLLFTINHQSLIATKASRIVRAAKPSFVLEFGARRAHGISSALKGSRSAFIAGITHSSNTLATKIYNKQPSGTMSHSFVQFFEDEYQAFKAYVKLYPSNPVLLIDTYDCLKGLEVAIAVFKEFNIQNCAVRIDSGNLATLSKKVRKRLDEAGLKQCKIIVSNSLDEFSIEKLANCPIDGFGVGEKLITASSDCIFGCVYKLVAIQEQNISPKIKISNSPEKTTVPHFKKLFRIYDKTSKKALYDELYIYDENLKKLNKNHERVNRLECVFSKDILVKPSLDEISNFLQEELKSLDDKFLKLKPKSSYKLVLSKKLLRLKEQKHV